MGQDLFEAPNIPPLATIEDATQSLKRITVAEAAERHWKRAKDTTQLFAAIKAKIEEQAAYVVWRQDALPPSQVIGGPGRGKRTTGLSPVLPDADPGQKTVERWRKRLCVKRGQRWVVAADKLQKVLEDAHHRCVRICEQENAGTIRGTEGTGEFERYTPAEYVDRVRQVLGTIDLDPASSAQAQETVRADSFFEAADNGLEQDWLGRVFLNPPYHRELAPQFIDKLLDEIAAGHTTEAVLLTNNSTDTAWFQKAFAACQCLCFLSGRINFTVPGGDPVSPTQGQLFLYFGKRGRAFVDVFETIGECARRTTPATHLDAVHELLDDHAGAAPAAAATKPARIRAPRRPSARQRPPRAPPREGEEMSNDNVSDLWPDRGAP